MILTVNDAADWLRTPDLVDNPSFQHLVSLVDELVTEEWKWPREVVPARVKLLALNAMSRAWVTSPGERTVESLTRSIDDASRTERYSSTARVGLDGLLTPDELEYLHGASGGPSRTIGVGLSW